jgi:hypothetical protein
MGWQTHCITFFRVGHGLLPTSTVHLASRICYNQSCDALDAEPTAFACHLFPRVPHFCVSFDVSPTESGESRAKANDLSDALVDWESKFSPWNELSLAAGHYLHLLRFAGVVELQSNRIKYLEKEPATFLLTLPCNWSVALIIIPSSEIPEYIYIIYICVCVSSSSTAEASNTGPN